MKKHKTPLRKCVITNEQLPKQDLIRIVKNKERGVLVDNTGKINGRGAYLKKDEKIILKAKKTKKLDRHLDTVVEESIYTELLELLQNEE